MTLDNAVRLCELLLGAAIVQQSLEHLMMPVTSRGLYTLRLVLGSVLIAGSIINSGALTAPAEALLLLSSAMILQRCDGPYNGGSDRLSTLLQCCLLLTHVLPVVYWKELAFGYLALQVIWSYAMSGWVKIVNPEWRNGQALRDVFAFSAYPISESLRAFAQWPRVMWCLSWALMLFELVFPLSLLHAPTLWAGLLMAGTFHFLNACLLGLNRFFWVWLATYPALLWLQTRVVG
jgi:hypothetical protein